MFPFLIFRNIVFNEPKQAFAHILAANHLTSDARDKGLRSLKRARAILAAAATQSKK